MAASQYVTQANLEARFGAERVAQLFSIQQSDGSFTGSADAPSLTQTIIDASAELEEVLGVEFVIPFAVDGSGNYDPAIVEITSVFTMYRGMMRRPEYQGDKQGSAPYEQEYARALKRCTEIKEDKRTLVGQSRQTPANVDGQTTNTNPTDVTPYHYFLHNPITGEGGADSY